MAKNLSEGYYDIAGHQLDLPCFENQKEIKNPTLFQNNLPQRRPFDFPLIYR